MPPSSDELIGRWHGPSLAPGPYRGARLQLEINADRTFTAGDEKGGWTRIATGRIKFDVQSQYVDAYEWSYAIHEGHLVIGPFSWSDSGTDLGGSTWHAAMTQRNLAGSSALEEHSWTINLNADGTASYHWNRLVAGMMFGESADGTWTGDAGSSFSLILQSADTFAIAGQQAFPASATYTRVCD